MTSAATPNSVEPTPWHHGAVVYQIYPRSFADGNGDGVGDLPGVIARLDALAELGVDALWLSPFMTSPQRDGGYDVADYVDVDPRFGTLEDFRRLCAEADRRGLQVIIDIVPNHSSDQHPWFQEALASPAGSAARDRYLFRPGRGAYGELPPNNWESTFGGPGWTRVPDGEWYLHLFDSSQPDFDWTNPEVHELFREVLRFWLDQGVSGFRVDVANCMVKADGLPDDPALPLGDPPPGGPLAESPQWNQDGVHEIIRDWRAMLDEHPTQPLLCAEAWVDPLERLALWTRPDEMHQAFNFTYLQTPWEPRAQRASIDRSLAAFTGVGAESTWVQSNHDVIRHPTRLMIIGEEADGRLRAGTRAGDDTDAGLTRARAATLLMLALPGSAYLFQGEELGLPEVVDLPDELRQDPIFARTGGTRLGRDGCRVPIPWEADAPAYGFSESGCSWLPQPSPWADLARDRQRGVPGSTLELYKGALRLRREHGLGHGELTWLTELPGAPDEVLGFRNGAVTVLVNFGAPWPGLAELTRDREPVLASSALGAGGALPTDTTVWLTEPRSDHSLTAG